MESGNKLDLQRLINETMIKAPRSVATNIREVRNASLMRIIALSKNLIDPISKK